MNDKILQYYNLIFKVMNDLHCRSDDETQDEMFFEGLMGLYNGISTYKADSETSELTYYYICIRNSIICKFNYNTRTKRDTINTISLETPIRGEMIIADILRDDMDLERDIIKKEQLEYIYREINKTKNSRFKRYLYDYYGIGTPKKKLPEIASKYGVSAHNVSASLRQGIERLKKKVEKEYEKQNKKAKIKN